MLFIIPAFSYAIFSIVSPSLSVWSRLIDVITESRFVLMAEVASSRPPSPVSIMQMSVSLYAKYLYAAAVRISNSVR
ncbi:TPA: hypothetical protein CPT85_04455 [Candidatus Gastranaerophilales bacterium HUM_21]|nr:MAG TPA: hypothetical protein CPT85_04455 [Candidatus Gastranaerophilales bacterium HUM_21]